MGDPMTARLTREQILTRKIGGEVVTLPSGGTVKVRGLTRNQAQQVQDAPEGIDRDSMMIHLGLVDPELSAEDVVAWFDVAPAGDVLAIAREVSRLSGMLEGQGKQATKSVPRRRGR